MSSCIPVVKLLISQGCNINNSIGFDQIPIILYIFQNQHKLSNEMVKYLIEETQLDTSLTDNNKDSIAHFLASSGKTELLKLLPKEDLCLKNSKSWIPLHFAIEASQLEAAKLIISCCPEALNQETSNNQESYKAKYFMKNKTL